jgi:hypothetical protein
MIHKSSESFLELRIDFIILMTGENIVKQYLIFWKKSQIANDSFYEAKSYLSWRLLYFKSAQRFISYEKKDKELEINLNQSRILINKADLQFHVGDFAETEK